MFATLISIASQRFVEKTGKRMLNPIHQGLLLSHVDGLGFISAKTLVTGGTGRNLHLHSVIGSFTDSWVHSYPAVP